MSDIPEVLFVCVHNAGRSQMAAALLDHHAGGRVHVRSAGSAPADQVNPAAVEALAEIGLDVTRASPKPLTDEVVRASDVVVTMGAATPVRSIRGRSTSIGSSTIPLASPSRRSARSGTRSTAGFASCSKS